MFCCNLKFICTPFNLVKKNLKLIQHLKRRKKFPQHKVNSVTVPLRGLLKKNSAVVINIYFFFRIPAFYIFHHPKILQNSKKSGLDSR